MNKNQAPVMTDFLRYIVAGGSAFIIDFTLLIFFTEITSLHYLISAPIAFIMALLFNYHLCINWVFKYRIYSREKIEFTIFCIIGIVGIFITEIILAGLTPILGNYIIVKLIACTAVLFWNFFMRRHLLFKKK